MATAGKRPSAAKVDQDDVQLSAKKHRSDRVAKWEELPHDVIACVAEKLGRADERCKLMTVCKPFCHALRGHWLGSTFEAALASDAHVPSFTQFLQRVEPRGLTRLCLYVEPNLAAEDVSVLEELILSKSPKLQVLAMEFWDNEHFGRPQAEPADIKPLVSMVAASPRVTKLAYFGKQGVVISSPAIRTAAASNCTLAGCCGLEVMRAFGRLSIDPGTELKRLRLLHFVSNHQASITALAQQLEAMDSLEELTLEVCHRIEWEPYHEQESVDMGNWRPGKALQYLCIIGPVDMTEGAALVVREAIPNLLLAGDPDKLKPNMFLAANNCRMLTQVHPLLPPYLEYEYSRGAYSAALDALPSQHGEPSRVFSAYRLVFMRAATAEEAALKEWPAHKYFPAWCPDLAWP